jgi:hypothetical protein
VTVRVDGGEVDGTLAADDPQAHTVAMITAAQRTILTRTWPRYARRNRDVARPTPAATPLEEVR